MAWWLVLIIAFIALDFVLVLVIFFKRSGKHRFEVKELKYIQAHWIAVIDSFEAHPRHAILDADKILDYALKKQGYTGSLGEKLKQAKSRFSDLNGIWSAHKLRNRVAHELGELDFKEAKRALVNFKRGLNDLGVGL